MGNATSMFHRLVLEALKHFADPVWLGAESPLARPYFLGEFLGQVERPETDLGRGQALQQLLLNSALDTWSGEVPDSRADLLAAVEAERLEMGNGGPCYLFLLLDLRYFRHFFPSRSAPRTVGAIYDFLSVSESAFFRNLKQARGALIQALLAQVQPSLRLEQPPNSAEIVGRNVLIASCLSHLHAGESVAVTGMGGIGKTSLASTVAQQWPNEAVFWFTLRPGLNDDWHSLLFSLAHFLRQWGGAGLWLQLIANQGRFETLEQALIFLRADLASAEVPLLLVFDEVDLLHTSQTQPRHGVHKLLLELLEALCRETPVMLVGQRSLIDTDHHVIVRSLDLPAVQAMLVARGADLTRLPPGIVLRASHGNPRLIELLLAFESDDLTLFERSPSVRPLFHRLWRRLMPEEKQVLAGLAAFREAVPADLWQSHGGMAHLQRRHLVKKAGEGGIGLLPFFKQLVYAELSAEQRQLAHRQAAIARAERGQITRAAYHFWEANDPDSAVALWFDYQDQEIRQGQSGAALMVFEQEPTQPLKGKRAKQLKVICNRLNLLAGDTERVLANMDAYSWHSDDELSAEALAQWGEAAFRVGDDATGLEKFDDSAEILARVIDRLMATRMRRGSLLAGNGQYDAASAETVTAQVEVCQMRGILELNHGRHRRAISHLEEALALATNAGNEGKACLARYYLTLAFGNLGELEQAQQHADIATTYFHDVGDRVREEGLRAELAGCLLNVGRFEEVIPPAERALSFFDRINHRPWIANLSSNLAEAYFETGQLERAEDYALRARATEEGHVQPYAYYTLGLVYEAKEDPPSAETSFQYGLESARQNQDDFILAYLHRVYGQFLARQERIDEAREQLVSAETLFTSLAIPREVDATRQQLDAL